MYELTKEEKKKVVELEEGLAAFVAAKVVDENTPMQYVTHAISNKIEEGENSKRYVVHAVNLLMTKPDEATQYLEEAGYTVNALPRFK